MKLKKILGYLIVLLFIGIICFFQTKSYFERKLFFERKLNTIVIKKKGNWTGGVSYDYITQNNTVITIGAGDNIPLELEDSIVKEANSWHFDIYKKEGTGKYKFYKNYKN